MIKAIIISPCHPPPMVPPNTDICGCDLQETRLSTMIESGAIMRIKTSHRNTLSNLGAKWCKKSLGLEKHRKLLTIPKVLEYHPYLAWSPACPIGWRKTSLPCHTCQSLAYLLELHRVPLEQNLWSLCHLCHLFLWSLAGLATGFKQAWLCCAWIGRYRVAIRHSTVFNTARCNPAGVSNGDDDGGDDTWWHVMTRDDMWWHVMTRDDTWWLHQISQTSLTDHHLHIMWSILGRGPSLASLALSAMCVWNLAATVPLESTNSSCCGTKLVHRSMVYFIILGKDLPSQKRWIYVVICCDML